MVSKSRKKLFINLAVFTVTLSICLIAAEFFFRLKDRQPLFGTLETLRSPIDPKLREKVDWLSLHLAEEYGADSLISSLYPLEPDKRTYGREREELKALMKTYPSEETREKRINIVKIWNRQFLKNLYCTGHDEYSKEIIPADPFLYVFNPPDSSAFPVYRYFQNSALYKFRLNDFGWGGDSVVFIKPQNTIRIAFLGASTTQQRLGCDFAYPDYVGNWLNAWAQAKKIPVRFEVINAGRVGLKSMDFAAIMRYELAPVEPDLTVYYEGRNQMGADEIACRCSAEHFTYRLLKRFALLRRVIAFTNYNMLQHAEHAKTENTLRISRKVNIGAPDIHSPLLPINLPQILADIDSIRVMNERINGTLMLCSYAMLTDEATLTNGLNHAAVYSYWMHQLSGLRLEDIALLNGLENRAFKAYCDEKKIPFIDVAKELTRLPEAFIDGIHLNCAGSKYHGWIAFLQLLPWIEEQISTGKLPKPSTQTLSSHPYLSDSFERVALPYQCY